MVMHPTNPKLEGQNLSAIRDPNGFALFNEMVAIAKAKGAGMVDYLWPKPGAEAPVAKTSYVTLFEPWGWIIGSGVYVDDVQAEFRRSEEHTSELQSLMRISYAVFCLKQKNKNHKQEIEQA